MMRYPFSFVQEEMEIERHKKTWNKEDESREHSSYLAEIRRRRRNIVVTQEKGLFESFYKNIMEI